MDEENKTPKRTPPPLPKEEDRKNSIETSLELIIDDLRSINKRLSEMEDRMQHFEDLKLHGGSGRPSSSAKFKIPTAHEIELAAATSDLAEKSRDTCKHLRGWSSATGTKLPHQIPEELEAAIARYDTIRHKP